MRGWVILAVLLLAAPAEARDWRGELTVIHAGQPQEFAEPADYQRQVIRLVDWLVSVQPDLVAPRAEVKRRQAVVAAKAVEFGGPVEGANQRIAIVERDFGSPMWLARGRIGTAREELGRKLFPGRADLDSELYHLLEQAKTAHGAASAVESAASDLDAKNWEQKRGYILYDAGRAGNALGSVEQRTRTVQELLARGSASSEIEEATEVLARAVATYHERKRQYDAAMSEPLKQLRTVTAVFDGRMAPYRAELKRAEAALAEVEEPYNAGMRQYQALGTALNVLTEVNWKVFKGFDYKAYWAAQGKRLQ